MTPGEGMEDEEQEYGHFMAPVTDEAEYLRNLGGEGCDLESINFADPDLQYRLGQHLSVVVQNAEGGHDDNNAWRIHAALIGIDLTVRDALMLGFANLWDIKGIGEKRLERIRSELRRYIPEFPLMDDYAPPVVARKLYDDPNEVPITAPIRGVRSTVADSLRHSPGMDDYYGNQVRAIVQAYEVRAAQAIQEDTASASDPTIAAIAAVAVTLGDE